MASQKIQSSVRRRLLLAFASVPLVTSCSLWPERRDVSSAQTHIAALEKESGGRLGLVAFDTAGAIRLEHRAAERFPVCSTFKLIAVSAILTQSTHDATLLQKRISYVSSDLVANSPITEKHVGNGMTVAELCAAALQYSDNTAANLLMKILGGPSAVTAFARSIGDRDFRLDRWETELNTAIPGDLRDTATPASMARNLQRLLLGGALPSLQREQLRDWMLGNTTSAARVRAGVPADWQVADKTGGGDYGTNNDIAVLWPPGKPPIVLALYFTQPAKDAKPHDEVLASATRIVVEAFRA
jgi:beta-lactamase class A